MKLARLRRYFVAQYLTADARSLGFGRIVLALILLLDLVRRVPDITLFYSNQGLVPNHMMLWRPPTQWMFSLFFMLSHPDEVAVGFAVCGLIYLLLLVGWRTRLMQVLAVVAVLSLHGRVTLLENGGDWMLGELTLWTAFLPLGRRFSVDAVRASLRARPETSAAELGDREAMASSFGVNVVSLAVLALALQLADAYLFNAVHKGGPTWRAGTAVHYVLHQDRIVTWFAVWMRPHMPLWLSRALSWGTLVVEAILPVMLLAPVQKTPARRVAIASVITLHLGFASFINVGVFSFAMIGYTPFLLTAADWEALGRFAKRRGRRLTAFFDAGCGLCFQTARVWARLDRFGRVTFRSSADLTVPGESAGARSVTPELLARTTVVVDEETGRIYTRADAVAQILGALPLGWLWALPLRLPGLNRVANWSYDVVSRRREAISTRLGLEPCGAPTGAAPPAARAPLVAALRRLASGLRETAVLALLVTLVSETLFINAAVPKFLKHEQPLWIKRLVAYPRLIQAWSMFASDAPTTDLNLVVDAVTVDGRHVDPYSEVVGRYPNPGRNEIPVRMDNDSLVFNYSGRIADSADYHQALTEWILRYHERTGSPSDRIVRFDCYVVEDDSPAVGRLDPRNVRSRVFLSYPPKP